MSERRRRHEEKQEIVRQILAADDTLSTEQATWLSEIAKKTMIVDGVPLRSDNLRGDEIRVDEKGIRRLFAKEGNA